MKKFITALSFVIMSTNALAATEYLNVDENSFKGEGSITFTCEVGDIPIDGVELSLYKIADGFVEDDHVFYYTKVNDDYVLMDDFDDMTAIELYDYATECNKDNYELVATEVSDEDGVVTFNLDNYGMYLVVQTGASGTASHYSQYTQFLMSVPNVVDKELVYDIESYPKATIVDTYVPETPETPKTPNSPKTGDATSIGLLVLFAACSLAGIIILIKKRKEH
jgi:LPXTG-motif cell wall-anchored protein